MLLNRRLRLQQQGFKNPSLEPEVAGSGSRLRGASGKEEARLLRDAEKQLE